MLSLFSKHKEAILTRGFASLGSFSRSSFASANHSEESTTELITTRNLVEVFGEKFWEIFWYNFGLAFEATTTTFLFNSRKLQRFANKSEIWERFLATGSPSWLLKIEIFSLQFEELTVTITFYYNFWKFEREKF